MEDLSRYEQETSIDWTAPSSTYEVFAARADELHSIARDLTSSGCLDGADGSLGYIAAELADMREQRPDFRDRYDQEQEAAVAAAKEQRARDLFLFALSGM